MDPQDIPPALCNPIKSFDDVASSPLNDYVIFA